MFSDDYDHDSMGWLRLLHHCLLAHKEVQQDVALAATPTCNLLNTCTSLLVSPATSLYAAKIESVLLRLGLSSEEIGLALIDNVLRNPVLYGDRGEGARDVCSEGFGLVLGHVLCEVMKVGVRILTGLAGRVHCDVGKKCLGCCVPCVNFRFLQGKVFRMRVLLVSICWKESSPAVQIVWPGKG